MKQWYEENLRILQTILRENDIVDYDAAGVAEYMDRIHANTLVVNAGGVMDFFKNPLPMAKENPLMKPGQDILADLARELHARGMKLMVRVDFRGVEPERYEQHPDWFAVGPDGKNIYSPLRKVSPPCYNSYYANEHAVDYISYLIKTYAIDGIWENAVTFGMGACYCKRCKEKYRKDTGKEIPMPSDPSIGGGEAMMEAYMQPNFAEYRAWKARCADDHVSLMHDTTKSFGEDKAYCAEIFGIHSNAINITHGCGLDHDNGKRHFDFLTSCHSIDMPTAFFGGSGRFYEPLDNAGAIIRFSRALAKDKQPVICTGGNGGITRYVTSPALENKLWFWEIVSVGGGIWFVYFNGQHPGMTYDRRGAYRVADPFKFLADNQAVMQDSVPVRDVGLYYSYSTRDRFANADEQKDMFGVQLRGAERVMGEHHIPYGYVLGDEELTLESLSGVKTLVLPNAAVMSDEEAEIIREYVKNGGGLVATYQSSLYRPDGSQRENFALADVFGCDYADETVHAVNDYYCAIVDADSPVLAGVQDTSLISNGGYTAMCRASAGHEVTQFIPQIANQPPEYAWRADMGSEFAGIVTNSYGKGRVVYFANTTDMLCYTNGHEDFTEIFGNAVDYTSGEDYLVKTDAYRSVHVNVVEHACDDGAVDYVLSFINETGCTERPIKEVVPVGRFTVEVAMRGKKLLGSKLLWGEGMPITEKKDRLYITVEGLEEFKSLQLHMK